MSIRLVASDLDGTLLSPTGQLSARTVEAIASVSALGIKVVAATGRSFRTAEHRLRASPQLRTIVCSNGALVYDMHRDEVVGLSAMAGDRMRHLFSVLRAAVPDLKFGWETRLGFGLEPDFGRPPGDSAHDPSLVAGPQAATDVAEAVKAFVAHPSVEQVELQRLLEPHLPDGFNAATSGARFIEVTAAGVDKGTTVAAMAAGWGIEQREVLAIGDQMNDESMLRWAGTAVAMGNAVPEMKAIADFVAPTVQDEGAAAVLERLAAGDL